LKQLAGFSLPYDAPHFNEFVVTAPEPAAELLQRLARERNINGGLPLSRYFPDRPNDLLVCVTETNSRAQIDALVDGLKATAAG
jgi:glycine dehydrogenase subunit 1